MITGRGNDNLIGDANDNYLDGGGGNDTLFGGVGSDTLRGLRCTHKSSQSGFPPDKNGFKPPQPMN
ncbi:MAG: hypothetical protein ACFCU8_08540 [Thermosynechococcaceae cyanobacterium]